MPSDPLRTRLCDEYGCEYPVVGFAHTKDVVAAVTNAGGIGIYGANSLTPEQIQLAMQNLVIGRFHSTQQAGRRMIAAGKGSIMSIVSIAGFTALGRHHIPYSMAMGAVAQMTRELSSEWAPLGVRVNAIVCAQVENQGLQDRMEADPVLRSNFLRGLPIGRLGRPEEIKGLAILLASDASSFMTGALVPLDGGNLAKNAGGSHPGMPPLGPS